MRVNIFAIAEERHFQLVGTDSIPQAIQQAIRFFEQLKTGRFVSSVQRHAQFVGRVVLHPLRTADFGEFQGGFE